MKEVYDFLKECETFYLATIENNEPRVRPFGALNIFEDKLYLETGRKKKVSKQIEMNPIVEICAYNGKEWLRLTGKLVRDDRIIAKQSMLDNNPKLKALYSAQDENTEVLYFEYGTAVIKSFTCEPRTISF